jgi:voltage-gated potassium channel
MRTPDSIQEANRERWRLLRQIDQMLEMPMVVLGFGWLALLVWELTAGLSPAWEAVNTAIWVAFVLDFMVKLLLAPAKADYLRRNVLVAISLAVPALRVFRIARAIRGLRMARAARALRFARVLSGLNRGLHALRSAMRRRGLGYVLGLTGLVALGGAAGMYAFEHDEGQRAGFDTYAAALWWTFMLLTSIGSEYWPTTASGRTLCLLLSVYGFAVFGYITAALASYFVGRDAQKKEVGPSKAALEMELRSELAAVRSELRALRESATRGRDSSARRADEP